MSNSHPLRSKVEETVKSSPVVIFMKGTPDFPQCDRKLMLPRVCRELP